MYNYETIVKLTKSLIFYLTKNISSVKLAFNCVVLTLCVLTQIDGEKSDLIISGSLFYIKKDKKLIYLLYLG